MGEPIVTFLASISIIVACVVGGLGVRRAGDVRHIVLNVQKAKGAARGGAFAFFFVAGATDRIAP